MPLPAPDAVGSPPRHRVALTVVLEVESASRALLGVPGGALALRRRERRAEIARRYGRRARPVRARATSARRSRLQSVSRSTSCRKRAAVASSASQIPARCGPASAEIERVCHGVPGRRRPAADGAQLLRRAGGSRRRRPDPAERAARAERRLQPGLGIPAARRTRRRSSGSGRARPNPTSRATAGCAGMHRAPVWSSRCRASRPTSTGTPSRTRAGPTRTSLAGRCRTGTSTPGWPRCSCCRP